MKKNSGKIIVLVLLILLVGGGLWLRFKFFSKQSNLGQEEELKERMQNNVEPGQLAEGQQTEDAEEKNNTSDEEKDSTDKKEFTPEDLKNFWLEIDTSAVKVKAPIVEGIEESDLALGLGKHRTTPYPDQPGNLVISGHRWKPGDNPAYHVFEDLPKLKKGDRIKVHYKGKIYEYEVIDSGVVNDDRQGAVEILMPTKEKVLTLYTCTPKYNPDKRIYYRAKFIKEESEK